MPFHGAELNKLVLFIDVTGSCIIIIAHFLATFNPSQSFYASQFPHFHPKRSIFLHFHISAQFPNKKERKVLDTIKKGCYNGGIFS